MKKIHKRKGKNLMKTEKFVVCIGLSFLVGRRKVK
jgi:hypothetical protein